MSDGEDDSARRSRERLGELKMARQRRNKERRGREKGPAANRAGQSKDKTDSGDAINRRKRGTSRDNPSNIPRGSRFGDSVPLRGKKKKQTPDNEDSENASDNVSDAPSDASTVEGAETPRGDGTHSSNSDGRNSAKSMLASPLTKKFSDFPFLKSGAPGSLLFPKSMTRAQMEDLMARTSGASAINSDLGSGFYVPRTPFFAHANDLKVKNSKQNTAGRIRLRLMRELDSNTLLASSEAGQKASKNIIDPEDQEVVKGIVRDNWFQKSGIVRTMADPIDQSRKMPFALANLGAITDTAKPAIFCTKHLQGRMGRIDQNTKGKRAQIDVRIGRVRFTNHSLFDSEDKMAHELIALHAKYWSIVSSDLEAFNLARVLSCGADLQRRREEVMQYNLMDSRQGDELIDCTMGLFNAWSEYIAVFRSVRKLERDVYAAWKRLRVYREETGISRTSAKLTVRHMDSCVRSMAGWDKIIMNMRMLEEALEMIEPKLLEIGMNYSSGLSASLSERVKIEFESFTVNEISDMRGKDAVPLLLLSEKNPITPSGELEAGDYRGEAKRRLLVEKKRYYGRIKINGNNVCKTRVSSLRWPTFECDFSTAINIEVTRQPRRIELEIWEKGVILGLTDKKVSSVPIALKGSEYGISSSTAIAPIRQVYSFAAINPIKGYAASSAGAEKDSPGDDEDRDNDDENSNSKQPLMTRAAEYTRGKVEVSTAWIGWLSSHVDMEGETVAAPLPVVEIESSRKKTIGGAVDRYGNLANRVTSADGYSTGQDAHEQSSMRLAAMAGSARYDPNDPKNINLERVRKRSETSRKTLALGGAEVYRVESFAETSDARFLSRDTTQYRMPDRQVLLQMRHEMPHLFRHGKPLPLTDEEVLADPHWRVMLAPKMQKKRRSSMTDDEKHEEDEEEALTYFGFDSEFLIKRQNRMKSFIERVRSAQLELRGNRRRRAFLSMHVREGILPDFSLDFSFIAEKLAPKRKLRPTQKKRKEVPMVKDVYLVVQVAGALRVPQRRIIDGDVGRSGGGGSSSPRRGRSPDRRGENTATDNAEENYYDDDDDDVGNLAGGSDRINTFVEASFQGQSSRTTARGGTMPVWNETLRCRFVPQFSGAGSRWTSSNLKQVRDKIVLSLFDEQVHKNESDFRHRNAINIRRERRYLGSVSIPFTTIYNRKQISGLFRLDRPVFNLGYDHPPAPGAEDAEAIVPGSEQALKLAADEATCKLNLFMSIMFPSSDLLQAAFV